MDNDKIRRGKPSTHIKFGEASAVLAGSSLLTLAFEIISDKKYLLKPKMKNEITKSLANCSGHTGIAGGQELDLKFENKNKKLNQVIEMQKKKTGKLFNFCLYAVGVIAKKSKKEKAFLSTLGEEIGLIFQLADDFLDKKGSKHLVGKPVKKDNKKGKSTLLNLMGEKKAYLYANNLKKKILRKLEKHGKKAKELTNTIEFILERKILMGRLIKQINFPADLRKFKKEELKKISDELREELIDVVSETGGHLGAGLGVVELTVALHYVFDTPKDKLVWDVSHQCYPHKIITGRREKIKTLRKGGGLSGFTKRTESEYDPFGAAHSSTSISSTLGMAVAKTIK